MKTITLGYFNKMSYFEILLSWYTVFFLILKSSAGTLSAVHSLFGA